MKRKLIIEIISYIFIILFLYTGLSKLIDNAVFREQIAVTPIFSKSASFISWFLPSVEIFVSILLFLPKWKQLGMYVSLILMSLFTGYIIYIINVDEKLPCSCGGVIELLSWKQHLVLNGLLILFLIIGISLLNRNNYKDKSTSELVYN